MALLDFFNPNAPQSDTFNYGSEADKIKRKRALAQSLMDQSLQQERGQVVPGGPNGFYVAPNRLMPHAKMLQAYMGKSAMTDADSEQGTLDARSASELASALDAKPWEERARQGQMQREAEAEMLRESRRGSGVEGGEQVETFPVREGSVEMRDLPPGAPMLGAKLMDPAARVGTEKGRMTNPSNATTMGVAPAIDLGPANPATAGRKERMAAMLGQKLAPTAPAAQMPQAPVQSAPQAPQMAAAQPTGPLPDINARPAPAPMPPQAEPLVTDSRSMVDQAAAAAQPTAADRIEQIMKIYNTGPMGKEVANTMFQQTFGPKANGLEFKTVKQGDNEVLVAVNPRSGATQVVYGGGNGGPSLAQRKDKREEIKTFGEQRRAVGEAQQRLQGAEQAITDFNTAIGLAKDVGIQGVFSMGWEKAKNMFKENPKYAALDMLTNDETLRYMNEYLKGAPSDREGQRVANTRPQAGATVQEWLQWAERAQPVLLRAQARAKSLYDGEVSTARELGIPEYLQDVQTPPTQPTTRLDWKR